MNNKKGQYGVVFIFLIVTIVFILGLSSMVSFWGKFAVDSANLTGLTGFIFGNLNLMIIFIGIIGFVLWFKSSS